MFATLFVGAAGSLPYLYLKDVGRVISEEPHSQSFHTYLHPLKCFVETSLGGPAQDILICWSSFVPLLFLLSWFSAICFALEVAHPLAWEGVGLLFALQADVGLASF